MAVINSLSTKLEQNTAYYQLRRSQARIASFLHFRTGSLSRYLKSTSFKLMANRLAEKYFHLSQGAAMYESIVELYMILLIIAPILQRIPLSMRFDWHTGHVLSVFRADCSRRRNRIFYACREIPREYAPETLSANLQRLGIHDAIMVKWLHKLYDRHTGGKGLQHTLANQLFDPIMLLHVMTGRELRVGNRLHRLEKTEFQECVDIRRSPAAVFDYLVLCVDDAKGRHTDIKLSDAAISRFKYRVTNILAQSNSPAFKEQLITSAIDDFSMRSRWARSSLEQILGLKSWLAGKLTALSATQADVRRLPDILVNTFLMQVDTKLYFKAPNFFLNRDSVIEKAYFNIFTPYREVQL